MVGSRSYLPDLQLLVRILLENLYHKRRLDLLHPLRLPNDLCRLLRYDRAASFRYVIIFAPWLEVVLVDEVHLNLGLLNLTALPSVVRSCGVEHARAEQEVRVVVAAGGLDDFKPFDLFCVVYDSFRRECLEALVRLEDLLRFTLDAELGSVCEHCGEVHDVRHDSLLLILVYPHGNLLLGKFYSEFAFFGVPEGIHEPVIRQCQRVEGSSREFCDPFSAESE